MGSWKIINRLVFLALTPALCIAVFLTLHYSLRIIGDLNKKVYDRGEAITNYLALASEQAVQNGNRFVVEKLVKNTLLEEGVVNVSVWGKDGNLLYEEKRQNLWNKAPNYLVYKLSHLIYDNSPVLFRKYILDGDQSHIDSKEDHSHDAESASPQDSSHVVVGLTTEPTNYLETIVIIRGIAIVFVMLGISTLFALYTGRSISRPIERLTVTVKNIQKGHFKARIAEISGGEIGALEQGFNQMAERIQGSHEHLMKSINLATSELNKKIYEINEKNRELEIARVRAEDANLAKSRFLANMSHELRTPMNSVIGFADLLSEYRVDEGHRDYVNTIRRSAADLLVLINEILDYSKIESGELKIDKSEFNLYELIDGVINLLSKSAYEKDLDLLIYVDPNIPLELISDPLRLKQAVINLLSNAIKFTNEGYVSLEIHKRMGNHNDNNMDYLEFRVIDTGIGIKDEDIDTIFEPFTQSDDSLTRRYSGTGLGLSITKHFIEKLGGDIGFSTKIGKGSTFWFIIPYEALNPRFYYQERPLTDLPVLIYDRHTVRAGYTQDLLAAWGLKTRTTGKIDTFIDEYTSANYELILYYLNRNDVDTDLQISINKLAAKNNAAKFFMHNSSYFDDLSPATGFVHLSNVISPHQLFEQIYTHTTDLSRTISTADKNSESKRRIPRDLNDSVILVADDNEINQHLLKVYVSRNGGDYLAALDGQQAIDLCQTQEIDVVIMDVHMPNVDGIGAMRAIKQSNRNLPVIAVTADASPENISKYLDYGFDACLTKPVMETKLLSTIFFLLDRSQRNKVSPRRRPSAVINNQQISGLPIIDTKKAIKISGGKKQLAHELFNMLIADLRSKRPQLEMNDTSDLTQIKELAHKIRGGARYCAADRIQIHAGRLQDAIEEKKETLHIKALCKELMDSIQELLTLENPYK